MCNLPPGTVAPLTVQFFGVSGPILGETVIGSIRRMSDAKYWTGGVWIANYVTVSFAEMAVANNHEKGSYRYLLTLETDIYEFVVRHDISGFNRKFVGWVDSTLRQNKTGFKLAADGLDSIDNSEITAKPTNFREWFTWLIQRFRRTNLNMVGGTGTLEVKVPSSGDVATSQALTENATDQTTGEPT